MKSGLSATAANKCPTPAQWQAALRGETDQATWAAIELHLLDCPECELTVDRLTEQSDTCVRSLCQGPALPEDEAVFRSLYQRLLNSPELGNELAGAVQIELPYPLGNYELLEPLGHGANGSVYKARHQVLDRLVAVKLLRPDLDLEPESVERFVHEARAVGKLNHPHIVRATDAGVTDGHHFLAMEFVPGIDLSSTLLKCAPLSIADACEVTRQAAEGLDYLHQHGFVHRDVKPSNLLLTGEGMTKLLDLGLVQSIAEGAAEGSEGRLPHGTADYMAPEQWNDFERVDFRCDLYGLGCTLAKLLTGAPPYRPLPMGYATKYDAHCSAPIPDLRAARAEIPEAVHAVYSRLMSKDPMQRFESAATLADQLRPLAKGADLQRLAQRAGLEICERRNDLHPRRKQALTRRQALLAGGAVLACGAAAWSRLGNSAARESAGSYVPTDQWRPLQPAEPALLLPDNRSPSARPSAAWTRSSPGTVTVHAPYLTLLNLGQPIKGKFVLAVELGHPIGHESAGLFFRYAEQEEGSKEFETIEFDRSGHGPHRLVWNERIVRPRGDSLKRSEIETLGQLTLPTPTKPTSTLEVVLGSGGWPQVRWNGEVQTFTKMTPAAKRRAAITDSRLATAFLGKVGLICSGNPEEAHGGSLETKFIEPRLAYV